MKIAFRSDASTQIGIGHVMRCLTLADVLAAQGAETVFLSADLPGNVLDMIRSREHSVIALPRPEIPSEGLSFYETWLGTGIKDDAAQVRAFLDEMQPDWVVMDHYALDHEWVVGAVPSGTAVMVIDDLADRSHACDILLDQNLGRTEADYSDLVSDGTKILAGPQYALLRPEFSTARSGSLDRRKDGKLIHILVSMGGVDKDNVTEAVLDILKDIFIGKNIKITAVLGITAPHLEAVQATAQTLGVETEVLSNVEDMAALMATADLAIGAAGSASWERCCLGVPTLILVIADNQRPAALALDRAGAAVFGGDIQIDGWKKTFREKLVDLQRPGQLIDLSTRAALVTDGTGTRRCAQYFDTGIT